MKASFAMVPLVFALASGCSSSSKADGNAAGTENGCKCTVNGAAIGCGVTACVEGTKYTCESSEVSTGDACGMVPCLQATNGPAPDVCDGDTQYCLERGIFRLDGDGGAVEKIVAAVCAPRPSGCASCDCIGDAKEAWVALGTPISGECSPLECSHAGSVLTQICFQQ